MVSLTRLKELLDDRFSEPFLRRGHVRTRWSKLGRRKGLNIKIGRRDITIDSDGYVHDSGTDVSRNA